MPRRESGPRRRRYLSRNLRVPDRLRVQLGSSEYPPARWLATAHSRDVCRSWMGRPDRLASSQCRWRSRPEAGDPDRSGAGPHGRLEAKWSPQWRAGWPWDMMASIVRHDEDCSQGDSGPKSMSPETAFRTALDVSVAALLSRVNLDWSIPAGTLEWSCTRTAEHVIDCVFSYALQLAARATEGFLPFDELHALPEASPNALVVGLSAIGELYASLLRSAPNDAMASDGLMMLDPHDWAARGAYEVLLHTHDILEGLGASFEPPAQTCGWVASSPKLWMFDRDRAAKAGGDPWKGLLVGSGR